jgi:hypothetical protein
MNTRTRADRRATPAPTPRGNSHSCDCGAKTHAGGERESRRTRRLTLDRLVEGLRR